MQRQAVRYLSNCKMRCRIKKWSSGLGKLLTKRLWICLAGIALTIYYDLEVPSVLVMYHLLGTSLALFASNFLAFFPPDSQHMWGKAQCSTFCMAAGS